MISKIKKPVSILLSLIMVFSMFTIVPLTASAAAGDYVPESEYLTFTAEEAGSTVTLNVASGSNFQYDLNGAGLTGYTPGTPITLENVDDYVRFSGKDTTFSSSSSNHFSITGKVACSGNVMSLRLDDDGKVQGLTDYCFDSMFSGCTGLTSAPELPETELKNYCYRNMFYRCENLTKAPELPATNLANGCYSNMFNGCSKLTELPALPATTLATYCYHGMFYRCENLTKAPELPATNLADFCYYYMFYGCKSLTEAPALPATNLANSCYYSMFSGCTSLTKAPELPATNLEESCYNNMFYGCKSLTELPTLPATTLARTCYNYMFYGCSKICISDQAGTFGDITYSVEYRIPTTGEGTSAYNALSNMFKNTGGEFRGTPDINTTYYVPAPAPETFKVYVKKLTGGTYTIENLTGETTVAQLKEIIADQIDIPATAQRLIFSGKTLENDKQLSEYNIQNESTIHLVISTYTVTWLNYDNSELGTTTVQYGATPSYDGETPTKAEDADYTYTFYGWSDGTTTYGPTDTLPAVTGEVTYTAVFDATPRHVHNVVHADEIPAGCTEPGRKAYYCCDDESCELYGRFFEDEELSVELTDLTIPALGHDYAAVVTEPSCTEGGYTTYTCSRCGDSYEDNFTDALGHDFGAWSVSEEPSCTESGEEIAICARCGETETRPVDALGHNPGEPVVENYVEPTGSAEGGYDTVVYCQRCSEELSREHTVLPATGPAEPVLDESIVLYNSIGIGVEIQTSFGVRKTVTDRFDTWYIEVNKLDASGSITETKRFNPEDVEEGFIMNAVYTDITAKEMGVSYAASFHGFAADGSETYSSTVTNTVRDYVIGELVKTDNDDATRKLAADLLNYGAAAQTYFNFDAENLVNTNLSAEAQAAMEQFADVGEAPATLENGSNGPNVYGSISVMNRVVLSLTVRGVGSPSEVKVLVKNHETGAVKATVDAVQRGSVWMADYAGFEAGDMRTLFDFVPVADGTETGTPLTWSVEGYAREARLNEDSTEEQLNLFNALLHYVDSCVAVFAS